MAIAADTIVHLIRNREPHSFLEAGLKLSREIVGATAGSLLFVGTPPLRLRHGVFYPAAVEQVDRWERGVQSRLGGRRTHPLQAQRAVTRHQLGTGLPILLIAPIGGSDALMGSLSLQIEADADVPAETMDDLHDLLAFIGEWSVLLYRVRVTEQRLTQMGLLLQVGQSMVSTFDLERLLNDTTELATTIVNAAAASLMLIDAETNELVFEYAIGEKGDQVRKVRIKLSEGVAGWVATHGRPLIANDVQNDPRFLHRIDDTTGFLTQSIAAVPLEIRGRTIGVMEVLNKLDTSGFDQEDLTMLCSIAAQAAIAIDNARLYQSFREERDRIIRAQEEVRRELARNLHDRTVQLLAATAMGLDHLEKLLRLKPEAVPEEIDSLRRLVRQTSKEARLLLFELRPVILETQGLVPALESYVDQLRSSGDFEVSLEVTGARERLGSEMEGTIFSIIQEAVNNIKRHAHPQHVWIVFNFGEDQLTVSLRDDGVGFDVGSVDRDYDRRGSFGLLNMRERSALIDGTLSIESDSTGSNRGTVVTLRVPRRQPMPFSGQRQSPSHNAV